ncbi:UNVERIFIED_CONTAM: thiamine-monophosphate kinase [Brevibacillus sp. OAP136]
MANDEFSYIRQWTGRSAGQAGDGLVVGIGDDAAVFSVSSDKEVIACCDAMVETVHFLRETMHHTDVGYKSFISNISDIAAMGGVPRFAMVTIAKPATWTPEECSQIYDGMYEACREYGVRIIGGDTVSAPDALHLSVTMLGEVERGMALLRSAAKPGDAVFVTGTVGGAAAGLDLLFKAKEHGTPMQYDPYWEPLVRLHQRPSAQVMAGRLLQQASGIGALNDVSDGLASELWEIAEASGVAISVERDMLPIAGLVREYAETVGKDAVDWALYGGEDYQLVGTVQGTKAEILAQMFARQGLSFSLIGKIEAGSPQVFLQAPDGSSKRLNKDGYNHFR